VSHRVKIYATERQVNTYNPVQINNTISLSSNKNT